MKRKYEMDSGVPLRSPEGFLSSIPTRSSLQNYSLNHDPPRARRQVSDRKKTQHVNHHKEFLSQLPAQEVPEPGTPIKETNYSWRAMI